ncbi:hypothetical protein NON00_03570 [Roseomonas sp. GC11]|uniref:hypothetical protein n=1 Tax=Roseomonas sp. GC11 TaxID=2950546 RepID=UPI00210E8149|nr:hypothetical protein [Roseomonas sp. GC11]MCQ4159002.1 hypothetical protein [Roseomonas sp. GC11]
MDISGISGAKNALTLLSHQTPKQAGATTDTLMEAAQKLDAQRSNSDEPRNGTIKASELLALYSDIDPNEAGAKILYKVKAVLEKAAARNEVFKIEDGKVLVAGVYLVPYGSSGTKAELEAARRQNPPEPQAIAKAWASDQAERTPDSFVPATITL